MYRNQIKLMSNLELTPFSKEDKEQNFQLNTFVERGLVINMLAPKKLKVQSGNLYKFGVLSNHKYYWFFKGKSLIKGRKKAIEVYKALLIYSEENNLEDVFMCKVLN